MKNILIAGFIIASTLSTANAKSEEDLYRQFDAEYRQLKPYQIESAKVIFEHAKKDDLSWTATAIAWHESQFGRWQINVNSDTSLDCGMFQNNTKSVAAHNDIAYNRYNMKEICTDLITSFKYAYLNFAKEVAFWERVHKSNWRKVWSSYNGGWAGNKDYATKIAIRIQVLKKYMKD